MGRSISVVGTKEHECQCSVSEWATVLKIARAYGWVPAGSMMPTEFLFGQGLNPDCPSDEELRREFDADPEIIDHFENFEFYRVFRREGGGIVVKHQDWDGSYDTGNGQYVTPKDARKLAMYLFRAQGDIVRILCGADEREFMLKPAALARLLGGPENGDGPLKPIEYEPWLYRLIDLHGMFKTGTFSIYGRGSEVDAQGDVGVNLPESIAE